jgi:hypothetical protein
MVWMFASAWGSFKIATASFGPGDGIERLLLWVIIWVICLVLVGVLMLKVFPDKPRGKFTLDQVSLRYWAGMGQYTEILDISPLHKMYEVGVGVNTFYAILEDTDDPTPASFGSVMGCRPVWVRSLQEVAINEQTDLLKITIDKDFMTKVEYLGPTACVTAECKWSFAPGEKK